MKIRQSKTILTTLLLTFLLPLVLAQLTTAQQASSTLYVDPSTYNALELGEVFTIDVNIANVTDLAVFEFKLGYNTTLLDVLEVVAGSFPPQVDFTAGINEAEGYVWVSAMCPATDGSGTLATITFEAASSGSCTLQLYDVVLGDMYGNPIPVDTSDGSVSVIPPVTTLYVDPSTYNALELGEVFTIDVNIANVTDLAVFEFKLGYNTTLLDVLEVVAGSFPPQVDFTAGINEAEGYVWVSAMCPATDGSGTLATITFEAASSGSCTLQLYDVVLGDMYGNPIPVDTSDSSYSAIPEFPVTIVTPLLLIATIAVALLGKMVWSRKR